MKKLALILLSFLLVNLSLAASPVTQEKQASLSPQQIVQRLEKGNYGFASGRIYASNLGLMKYGAAKGQFPLAIVLSCVDSRSIPEIVLGQKKGAMFAARLAGNVADKDVIGSMEFATGYAGSKVILVMGHTACGAVKAACAFKGQFKQNLNHLLRSIVPAVRMAKKIEPNGQCNDPKFINLIAKENVKHQIQQILKNSPDIRKLVQQKKVIIIGGLHNLKTGKVSFFDRQ